MVSLVLHVHHLAMKHQNDTANTTAMDAISALANIVSTTAVDDTSKKTDWSRKKTRVLVCLRRKEDGTKLPLFILFIGAKQETTSLYKEIKAVA